MLRALAVYIDEKDGEKGLTMVFHGGDDSPPTICHMSPKAGAGFMVGLDRLMQVIDSREPLKEGVAPGHVIPEVQAVTLG